MEKLEKSPQFLDIQKQRDEISLKASEMPEFQEAVEQAKSKLDAIKSVRALLKEKFSEISKMPEEEIEKPEIAPGTPRIEKLGSLLGQVSNEFLIAKDIVELLWEEK